MLGRKVRNGRSESGATFFGGVLAAAASEFDNDMIRRDGGRSRAEHWQSQWHAPMYIVSSVPPRRSEVMLGRLLVSTIAVSLLLQLPSTASEKTRSVSEQLSRLRDTDRGVRLAAVNALEAMAPGAKDAALALVEALNDADGDVSGEAGRALVRIGPESIPALVVGLRHESLQVRLRAAYALGELRENAKAALPVLVALLKDKDYVGNWRLESTIVSIGPDAIPLLTQALGASDCAVRVRVAGVLSRFHQKGTAAIPILIAALRHEQADIRRAALFYLKEMGPLAREAVPAIIELLRDDDVTIRLEASYALLQIGWGDAAIVPGLAEALNDEDERVRRQAALCLANFTVRSAEKAEGAVSTLLNRLDDDDATVRVHVAVALLRIRPDSKKAISALTEATTNNQPAVRLSAVQAVRVLGPVAASAAPALARALKDECKEVRRSAVGALARVAPKASETTPALTAALADDDYIVRLGAVEGLRKLGQAHAAIPELRRLLYDPEPSVRDGAMRALGSISEEARPR